MSSTTKHVIALHGSPRQGETWRLLERIADRLQSLDVNVERVHLVDYEIRDCVSCHSCLDRGSCPIKDDFDSLMERLHQADGIILASPVYMGQVSAQLKRFIDRGFIKAHRPTLAGKPLLAVSTAAGSYTRQVNRYLHTAGELWGLYKAGSIGRTAASLGRPLPERVLERYARILHGGPSRHRPALSQIALFHGIKDVAGATVPLDARYWQQHNLHDALYYYPCRLGWKRPISWLLHQMMVVVAKRLSQSPGKQTR